MRPMYSELLTVKALGGSAMPKVKVPSETRENSPSPVIVPFASELVKKVIFVLGSVYVPCVAKSWATVACNTARQLENPPEEWKLLLTREGNPHNTTEET